ncbi:MAG: DUF1015 domain-containing protein [Anaerolineaceae bacterium]
MTIAEKIGVKVPKILLPVKSVDHTKWAVIACDQFTSQPEYWQEVGDFVGDAPSTLHMILPEVWLHSPDVSDRIQSTQATMRQYLADGILEPVNGIMLVERSRNGKTQVGLVLALDLETYDYNRGSQTLIRATEGTILNRLPPRMQVRRGAALELPHILVLYDDPLHTVLSKVLEERDQLQVCYDFDLMQGSGHLSGRLIEKPELLGSISNALNQLIEPEAYTKRYGLPGDTPPLLFAMGDGNHSLATAKAIWEELKPTVGMDHPARYALVEIVNLHDPSLNFEAIHRILFNVDSQFKAELNQAFSPNITLRTVSDMQELVSLVNHPVNPAQRFGMIEQGGFTVVELTQPSHNLPVGSLQDFLDRYLAFHPTTQIDYVHDDDIVTELSKQSGNLGFYLPPIGKDSFFQTVILDGALPRKTFSMGHAKDKRFYMECRLISE